MRFFAAAAIVALLFVIVYYVPIVTFWAVDELFNLQIDLTLGTWLAAWVMIGLIGRGT